jgi:integrase
MNLSESRAAAMDAPDKDEFERLIQAANLSNSASRTIEDKFITYGAGRLTLRSGALLHLHEEWVDKRRKIINVPQLDSCTCGYCKERARKLCARNEDISYEEALDSYWSPKCPASARAIPYGFSETAIEIVERFVDEVGHLDMDQSTINRRVNTLQARAQTGNVYPHALRAAAAFFWANLGLEAVYLLAIMGWKDLRVAVHYIRASGTQLNERIRQLVAEAHDDWILKEPDSLPDPAEAVYSMSEMRHPRSPTPKLREPVANDSTSASVKKKRLEDFGFVCDD